MNAELTSIEQLTLDFARLVAGYPVVRRSFGGYFVILNKSYWQCGLLPDYPNDRNATIEAIEARGLIWERKIHRSRYFKDSVVYYVSDAEWNVTKSESVNTNEPHCIALMSAAVEEAKVEKRMIQGESIESKIKREGELAAIELELERRMPGFTGPVRKKESIAERRKHQDRENPE